MFLGRHEHNLDAKGRLAIPSRFRDGFAGGLVLTRGIDRCLAVYPMVAWEALAEKINALPMADADARQFRRMVFSDAVDLTLDGQGRIVVPPTLRAYAGLTRETIVVGVHTSVEIWSPERWSAVNAVVEESGESIAGRLADLL